MTTLYAAVPMHKNQKYLMDLLSSGAASVGPYPAFSNINDLVKMTKSGTDDQLFKQYNVLCVQFDGECPPAVFPRPANLYEIMIRNPSASFVELPPPTTTPWHYASASSDAVPSTISTCSLL